MEKIFVKTRPDDFYREVLHIEDLLSGKVKPEDSPLSLMGAVSVMEVLATAHGEKNATNDIRSVA